MQRSKAFTLVEVMIIVVIVGLLAAMAIPAFMRVKATEMAKRAIAGERLTASESKWLLENKSSVPSEYAVKLFRSSKPENQIEVENFQTITINGKVYKLVPQ